MTAWIPRKQPRAQRHSEDPGEYQLIPRLSHSVVNPGNTIKGEVFITGYGSIGPAKLAFYPSPGVVDETKSWARSGFESKDDRIIYGGPQNYLADSGNVITFMGVDMSWGSTTMFFDVVEADPPLISTETKQINAPIDFELVLQDNLRPGTYGIQFILTYHNGREWKSSTQAIQFTVRTLLQRHEFLVAIIAAIAALVTIIPGIEATWKPLRGLVETTWKLLKGLL